MPNELEARREGNQALEVHNHVHLPPGPPKDVLAQAVRETIAAVEDDWPPRRRRRHPRPRGRAGSFFAKVAAWMWELLGLGLLGSLNVLVLSQGLAEPSPALFGAKLSTMPGLGFMGGYAVWHKMLVGHLVALGFFCVMAFAWRVVVRDLLLARGNELIDEKEWNVKNSRIFWRSACGLLMATDAMLFFFGVTQSNLWTGKPHYFSAFLSTLMYLGVVAVYSFGCLYFWDWERSEP